MRNILVILDGWGIYRDPAVSAIEAASTPYFDSLLLAHPHATLTTFGEDVGLPDGQMGNSEVGHLNIGAGRVIYQELARINKSIRDGSFAHNPILQETLAQSTGTVHLIGLVSDGGVHSHINHVIALGQSCRAQYNGKICIHAFTDGRDVDPKSGLAFLSHLKSAMDPLHIPIASVIGRYYAMDRDKRWERTRLAYDLLVNGHGIPSTDVLSAVQESYDTGTTDEFIKPIIKVDTEGNPIGLIKNGDTVIFFNFRTDRPRQLTEVLSQNDHAISDMHALDIMMITMTVYDSSYTNVKTLFPESDLQDTLGEYLAMHHKSQLRAAETEKYPHVTYFFSGGREAPFPQEERILIPSPKVPTYDLEPGMSAAQLTSAVMEHIAQKHPDFVCLNFANTDMVGHTGVFAAAVKAAEVVDGCLATLIPFCLSEGYNAIIIADHGNADFMVNPDGTPNTAHSKNPVPAIFVAHDSDQYVLSNGRLADIAPTILFAMGLEKSTAMTGDILLEKKNG